MSDIGTIDACIERPLPLQITYSMHTFSRHIRLATYRTRINVSEGPIQKSVGLNIGYL